MLMVALKVSTLYNDVNSRLYVITEFLAKERQLFLGQRGEQLLEFRYGDISDKIPPSKLSRAKVSALQSRLQMVFEKTETRKASMVLSGEEREILWKKAGASRAMTQSPSKDQFSKFDDWCHLKTGA